MVDNEDATLDSGQKHSELESDYRNYCVQNLVSYQSLSYGCGYYSRRRNIGHSYEQQTSFNYLVAIELS